MQDGAVGEVIDRADEEGTQRRFGAILIPSGPEGNPWAKFRRSQWI